MGAVHDVVNQAAEPATSIHVYSPPLTQMTYYDPETLRPVETVRVRGRADRARPTPRPSCCTPRTVPEPSSSSPSSTEVSGVDRLLAAERAVIEPRARPIDLAGVAERGGLVVDIRPVDLRERDGLLPGALVIGRNVLEWRLDPTSPWRIPEVSGPDQEVVLFCDEGYASSLAAATLRRLGLTRATDLDGGFQAWRRAQGA